MDELDMMYEDMLDWEEDYPEDDYYEDWDNLEMGFDPYAGVLYG